MEKITFDIYLECECGDDLNYELQVANNLIVVSPCLTCLQKRVTEVTEGKSTTVREALVKFNTVVIEEVANILKDVLEE